MDGGLSQFILYIKKGVLMKERTYLLITFVYAFIGLTIPAAAPIMAQTADSGKAHSSNDTGKVVLTGWGSYETGRTIPI